MICFVFFFYGGSGSKRNRGTDDVVVGNGCTSIAVFCIGAVERKGMSDDDEYGAVDSLSVIVTKYSTFHMYLRYLDVRELIYWFYTMNNNLYSGYLLNLILIWN